MAILALNSSATALSALETELDVIANNLANVATHGFKASRANFQDLLYEERAQPGVENANGDMRPIGLYVGLGTRISGTQLDFKQGAMDQTGRDLDITIEGQGFFQVSIPDDIGDGLGYTRSGNFTLNADSEIVMASDQGRRLEPVITVPEFATGVAIREDGTVWATELGGDQPTEIGNIDTALFVNQAGLSQLGGNVYAATAASGEAQLGTPTEGSRGRLMQGFLETSNVDPVHELIGLIKTQRAFEYNSQSLQAADEVLQQVGRLRSF